MISGPDAFLLWDTFGFPVDLTQLMAEEHGLQVDAAGFEAAMEEARQKSRAGGRKAGVRTPACHTDTQHTSTRAHVAKREVTVLRQVLRPVALFSK